MKRCGKGDGKGKYKLGQYPARGGGGGVLTPNFGRYVPRQSEKWARAPERAPGRA